MRIISLNTWGGRALHPLMHFFKKYGPSTHVFCLQEMHDTTRKYREAQHPEEFVCPDLLARTRAMLPLHDGYFARWPDNPNRMSVAMFIRHDVDVTSYGTQTVLWPHDIHEEGSAIISPRKMQYANLRVKGCPPLTVVNYHGMWRDTGKLDTPERIEEMMTLVSYIRRLQAPLVLAGDLNLDPDTRAVSKLVVSGRLHQFVTRATVPTTRTPLYRHYDDVNYSSYADYVFVSRGIEQVCRFEVLPDIVSDHAPLSLEYMVGGS